MAATPKVTHSGHGGAGNIHSPSRDPGSPTPAEREVVAHTAERDAKLPCSSGRGGFGNIVDPCSRSSSHPPDTVHSLGRGGAGNMVHGGVASLGLLEMQEHREHHVKEGMCVFFCFMLFIFASN
jgi:Protein of unknown function (DUF3602)